MTNSPQDKPQEEHPASFVSGGVTAGSEGGQVNVGGDVTGRDKTVSAGTYVEHVEMHLHADRLPDDAPVQAGHYLDFEVEIDHGLGCDYPLAVIRSPAGEARETMHFPARFTRP